MFPPQVPTCTLSDLPPAGLPAGSVLLDVREDDEWAAGHAAQAVHLPMSGLPARLPEVPAGTDLLVVCRSGHRSAQVTAWLVGQGYPARNLDGGMLAWQRSGRPLVAAGGAAPQVR